MKIFAVEDGGIQIPESNEQFQEFLATKRFVHFVGMISPPRPGVSECVEVLEHTHYKPGTARNELFIMRIIEWSDVVWIFVSIPIEDKSFMEKIADQCGLRIANGIPTIISGNGLEQFPANNERVFTFENKLGNPVYGNDRETINKMLESECDNGKDATLQ